jgi:hypothetical protein
VRKSSVSIREPAIGKLSDTQEAPPSLNLSSMPNVLAQADAIIARRSGASSVLVRKQTFRATFESSRGIVANATGQADKAVHCPVSLTGRMLRKIVPGSALGPLDDQVVANARPMRVTESSVGTILIAFPPLERQFVEAVGRLLFLTEFLLLLNYVEVVIPIVYCA